MRKCSSLRSNEAVVFLIPSDFDRNKKDTEWGNVSFVDTERRFVSIEYLYGYQSRHYNCPFEDMLAVHNPDCKEKRFGCIHGNCEDLIPE